MGVKAVALFGLVAGLMLVAAHEAAANPRDGAQRASPRRPAPPPSTVQSEPTDLDEGKTPQQIFAATCSVCHSGAGGLAKGRSAGQLGSFLRQHYTTSTAQATTLGGYVASITGPERGGPRGASEPATASRRPAARPEEGRKPDPAAKPDKPEAAVAATQPARRMRNEDGSSQPVEGLIVLPPGANDVPSAETRPAEPPVAARPADPAPARQRGASKPAEAARPSEPAKPAGPVEAAKPAQPEKPSQAEKTAEASASAASLGTPPAAEATKPPSNFPLNPLTEDKPVPAKVQEIPL